MFSRNVPFANLVSFDLHRSKSLNYRIILCSPHIRQLLLNHRWRKSRAKPWLFPIFHVGHSELSL